MRVRAFLSALLLAIPFVAQSQDTTAIKNLLSRQKDWVRDSIDRDKSRPKYVKTAQDSALLLQDQVLTAMRKPVKPDTIVSVATVTIVAADSTLKVGGTLQLYGVPKDSAGNTLTTPVGWTATPLSIGTISGTGLLTGVSAGVVNVAAVSNGKGTLRAFTVTGGSPPDTTSPDTAKFDATAELPRSTVDVTLPIGFTIITVPAQAGALQAAIDAAGCRSEIRGAPGFSYSPIILKVKPCNERYHTIIRTANGLPDVARGTRMTPALSAQRNQTKIVTTGFNVSAVTAGPGVKGYYFEDVNIRATTGPVNGLVTLGTTQTTFAEVPGNFVFSHVYTGGTPTVDLKRCWYINSFSTAIVDSWSDECHSNAGDSQWTLFINGPGPYLLKNNYGEAGHEVVMSGGGDPSILNLIPSDITIVGNHITRPSSWKGVWGVKNLVEGKNVRRMLIEGNVIENNWADGQVGYAFNIKSVNQNGTASWSQSRDVVVRYNLIQNTGAGFNLCASCQGTVVPATGLSLHDNITINVNTGQYLGEAREWQFLSALNDLSVIHNTTISAFNVATAISFAGQPPKITSMNFSCNAYDNGAYGVHGGSGGSDWRTWVDTATSKWQNNLGYPPGKQLAAGFDSRGFYTGSIVCADGKPLGADAAKVYSMTSKSVVSDPTRSLSRRHVATPKQSGYKPTPAAQRDSNTKNGPSVQ